MGGGPLQPPVRAQGPSCHQEPPHPHESLNSQVNRACPPHCPLTLTLTLLPDPHLCGLSNSWVLFQFTEMFYLVVSYSVGPVTNPAPQAGRGDSLPPISVSSLFLHSLSLLSFFLSLPLSLSPFFSPYLPLSLPPLPLSSLPFFFCLLCLFPLSPCLLPSFSSLFLSLPVSSISQSLSSVFSASSLPLSP